MDNNQPKRPKKKAKDKSAKSKKRKSKKSSDANHRKVAVVSRGLPNDASDQKGKPNIPILWCTLQKQAGQSLGRKN